MADILTKKQRSQVMASVRSSGNRNTELKLAALFRSHGITGWRRNQRVLGKPDFVFRKQKVAVFVDGCFWHGCPKHVRMPHSNIKYWRIKIAKNKIRDRLVRRSLKCGGWQVVGFWEHELNDPTRIAVKIGKVLGRLPRNQKGMLD